MSQAPIQNQTNLNKDVSFFAPASTLGASELGVDANLLAGFLDFGQGGVLTGVGLRIAPVSGGIGGATSTLAVIDNTGAARTLATGGVYFDTPDGTFTSCSLLYQDIPQDQPEVTTVQASNFTTAALISETNISFSTLNGLPYDTTPGPAQFTVQAGRGNTSSSNAAIVTFAVPYTDASTLSITATPRNTLNTVFHPLTISDISQSTFVITSDTTGVGFSWIANGPVAP
jgi:hypothetical protein